MARTVKVAVVGSGLAGLTAAYLLTRSSEANEVQFEVHLFEKTSELGMDSSSVSLHVSDFEREWRVDVPMRSFQGGYYPHLIALYKRLGVLFRQSDFSYSFSLLCPSTTSPIRQITTTMVYNGASGRAGLSMPSVMDEPYLRSKHRGIVSRAVMRVVTIILFLLSTLQLVMSYARLIFLALPVGRPERVTNMTFREWAEESVPRGVLARWTRMDVAWRDFTGSVLVPLFSAVCTASENDVMNHPVEEFLDYIWLTFGTHHYVVVNGVRDVVSRLTSAIPHIYLSSPISAIHADPRNPQTASVQCTTANGTQVHSGFHHIIFATQATRAVPLLSSYALSLPSNHKRRKVEDQIRCLQSFKYHPTIVINHTDDTLMPNDVRDRRDLNLVSMDPNGDTVTTCKTNEAESESMTPRCVTSAYTMATHLLPPPPGYPPHLPRVYQTTNPIFAPKEECILSVAGLERAVLTLEAKSALKGLYRENGKRWWHSAAQTGSVLGPLQGGGILEGGRDSDKGPGIWICGSFAYAGIPLLEGCVVSARNVVEQGVYKSEGVAVKSRSW